MFDPETAEIRLLIVTHTSAAITLQPSYCDMSSFFNFVSIDERLAVRSQPSLASRSKVVSINRCPHKFRGPFPKNLGRQKHEIFEHFSATSALDTAYLRN